jgi:hypothetical protein
MTAKPKPDKANAQPSKNFFVNMLVRDIDLSDTLLDLLDNCVDGILRNTDPDLNAEKPYDGFWANFVIGPDHFELEDNCGGIPLLLAQTKAFAIGKPQPITGADAKATVGMYGIGMKRAIFKIGRNASVRTWADHPLEVTISPKWLDSDSWTALPLRQLDEKDFERKGTKVSVSDINAQVRKEFDSPAFLDAFERRISSIYALIIGKGFKVTLRRELDDPVPAPVHAKPFSLLLAADLKSGEAIAPVIFKGHVLGVDVELFAGLYRRLPDREEEEADESGKNRTDDAGWTVACNDRVVIDRDRTWVTGWGEAAVPSFHNQFIAITGLVLLSGKPEHLPLTTTKRGVDHGTAIYSYVKEMMREATKKLTDFTNRWKKFEGDLDDLYRKETKLAPLGELKAKAETMPMRPWSKDDEVRVYVPKLPVPPRDTSRSRVSFVANKNDVRKLAIVYFDDANAKAKDVGERAFLEELANYAEAAE